MSRADQNGQNVCELIVLCDRSSIVRFVSRSFADFFGAPAPRWIGQVFSPGDSAARDGAPARYWTTAKGAHGECEIEWEETLFASGERLYIGRAEIPGGGRRAADFREAAASDDDAKMRFLATMSHEMRTPLNGVLGMTGLLLDTELTANQRTYAEAVRESGTALLSLINDILDFSKLHAGRLELAAAPFDPFALIQSVTELLSPRAADKGIEIASFVDPATPRRLIGDEARIRQVLINLAGNGVKFTDEGGVAIEATTEIGLDGDANFTVSIRDTGVGIPSQAQVAIFEEFAQVDAVAERRSQGTGLGLAIARKLVQAMGGDISLTSEPGVGSVFSFTTLLKANADCSPPPAFEFPPVIVATRSATLERILHRQLTAYGAKLVRIEAEADAAYAAACETPEALVLCDLAVIDSGGEKLAGAARRSIALVAANERSALERLRNLGFDGYLMKPIRQSTLLRELARMSQKAPAPVAAPGPSPAKPIPHSATAARLRILLAEDNQINAVLATALIKRAGHTVDLAINGVEAVEAVSRTEYDLVLMDVHMPGMDGIEATRRIRALDGGAAKTPIVALTANAMASDRQKCVAAGMDDFLTKPFDPADFHAMIDKWGPRTTHSPTEKAAAS